MRREEKKNRGGGEEWLSKKLWNIFSLVQKYFFFNQHGLAEKKNNYLGINA